MWGEAQFNDDEMPALNVDELDDMELRIIAERVLALLERDALIDRERSGLNDRWSGWHRE